MNNTTLGICVAVMAAALIVGGTLSYNSANASLVGKPGGTAGNGQNGGFIHTNGTGTNLNGANGKDANGVGATG